MYAGSIIFRSEITILFHKNFPLSMQFWKMRLSPWTFFLWTITDVLQEAFDFFPSTTFIIVIMFNICYTVLYLD